MVTQPTKQTIPPAPSPLKKMPKIDGPKLATSASFDPKYQAGKPPAKPADSGGKKDLANKDHNSKFKLPETVSQSDIKSNSFKYGGGRSAGNRSMADNMDRKEDEQ